MGYIFLPILNLASKLFNAKASHVKVFMQEIFISTVCKAYKLDCNYRNLIFFFLNLTPNWLIKISLWKLPGIKSAVIIAAREWSIEISWKNSILSKLQMKIMITYLHFSWVFFLDFFYLVDSCYIYNELN